MIVVELFGVPRLRAGTGRLTVEAGTLSDALEALARACPALDGHVVARGPGRVLPYYQVSLNGERFLTDPATSLADGDVLLLLAADAGG